MVQQYHMRSMDSDSIKIRALFDHYNMYADMEIKALTTKTDDKKEARILKQRAAYYRQLKKEVADKLYLYYGETIKD